MTAEYEDVSLIIDNETNADAFYLIAATLHALEWRRVFGVVLPMRQEF